MTTLLLTDVDVQGVTIEARLDQIARRPEYAGHRIRPWPVMYETLGQVGGWQIEHAADCPGCTPLERAAVRQVAGPWGPVGRLDAHVTPATTRVGLVQS